MITLVKEYNTYISRIPELIDKSHYKLEYFISYLNISKPTMYRKLREKAFTTEEVQKLTDLLFPDELILQALEESEKDIKNGNTYTNKEAFKILRSKHFS